MNVDEPLTLNVRQRALDRHRLGLTLAQSIEVGIDQDVVAGMLAARLTAFVLTEQVEKLTQQTSVDVPSSTWQMWKQRGTTRFHRWLVRHRPVKMVQEVRTVTFTRTATYPLANLSVPDLGEVRFMEKVERR